MVILNLQGGCARERANATVPPGIMAFNLGVCVVGEGFMRDSWEHSRRTSGFFWEHWDAMRYTLWQIVT